MTTQEYDKQYSELNLLYRQALVDESIIRESVHLSIPYPVLGFNCKWLTPKMYMMLDFIQSPFIVDYGKKFPTYDDIIDFLWIVSYSYKPINVTDYKLVTLWNKLTKYVFKLLTLKRLGYYSNNMDVRKENYFIILKSIQEYLADNFLDAPAEMLDKTGNRMRKPKDYWAWFSSFVDIICNQYSSLTPNDVKDMPLAEINQYFKCIEARKCITNNEPVIMFNKRSDSVAQQLMKLLKLKNSKGIS